MKNTLSWEKNKQNLIPFYLNSCGKSERYCAEDRTAAGILPWKRGCWQIRESKQGQELQGVGLQGLGGWEFNYKLISTMEFFNDRQKLKKKVLLKL